MCFHLNRIITFYFLEITDFIIYQKRICEYVTVAHTGNKSLLQYQLRGRHTENFQR